MLLPTLLLVAPAAVHAEPADPAVAAARAAATDAAAAAAAAAAGVLPTTADLAQVQAELAGVTAHAQQLADELELARARDGGVRRAVEELEVAYDTAQVRLAERVREVYIASGPSAVESWSRLTDPTAGVRAAQGQAGVVRVERELVDAVATQSAAGQAVRAEADRFRAGLADQATAVLAEQEQARGLLARAQQLVAERQAAAAGAAQTAEYAAATAAAAEEAARVAAAQAALDAVSQTVTAALTPAQTERSRAAARNAEPVLALLEATGSGYPAGYSRSGQTVSGTASWYGPGFVGSPTASGRPYDPERPSCAHKSLPLGTVLHVTANGRSTNCLVDDRGPYVGDRVLDLSRYGSRALGYTGTAEVVAEVLLPDA